MASHRKGNAEASADVDGLRAPSVVLENLVVREKLTVPQSVLEAIRMGIWDFEPVGREVERLNPTGAMPGTVEKLEVLAERLRLGLPLWHPHDRMTYSDADRE